MPDYPGKREPVNRKPTEPVEEHWFDKPTRYPFGGEVREFYTISHLAKALDKSPVTIRLWESKGILPKSSLRSPRPQRSPLGVQPKGRRLWTREQIEGILRIAREERCILNGEPPTERFTAKVDQLFNQLHTKFQQQRQTRTK